MTKDELQSFLPQKPQRLQQVAEPQRQQLVQVSYDVVGCIHEVYKQLGGGLPEYIYQESVRRWQALEDKYWLQFGSGF